MPETSRDSSSRKDETLFPLLTVTEARLRMGISRAQIYRLMDSGEIGYTPRGGSERGRLIPVAEIKRYADSLVANARRKERQAVA